MLLNIAWLLASILAVAQGAAQEQPPKDRPLKPRITPTPEYSNHISERATPPITPAAIKSRQASSLIEQGNSIFSSLGSVASTFAGSAASLASSVAASAQDNANETWSSVSDAIESAASLLSTATGEAASSASLALAEAESFASSVVSSITASATTILGAKVTGINASPTPTGNFAVRVGANPAMMLGGGGIIVLFGLLGVVVF
ncbi:uncharacterized protein BCR38DRAFT_479135 [Pseudomassariella vexata]|uniref:Uncharacterized protein n=1 Tax=Pseudomassariella vexata TaxID=1141098 RepID=A0A1Y2D8C6_9PEZI|nr:uncharacterized protein BCR38DRAFT_479135 [Pseudomassariella vexata]ORY55508.1 hypothetical protein BCR38DRAFT_479135 [Pseudomassariella vexata]